MPIDEYTFPHFVPRLGFLLHDMDMDKGGCGKVFTLYFFAKGVYFREVKQRGTEVHLEEEHWGFKPTQAAKDPLSAYSGQSGSFQRWTGKMGTTVKTLWCLAEWKLKLLSFPPHFRCSLPGGVQSWWRVDDGRGRHGGGQAISLICVAFVKTTHTNLIIQHCCLPIHILELPFYLDWSPNWSEGNPVGCTSDPDYNIRCIWTLRCWMTLPLTRPCSGRKSLTP